jgi:peptidyl-tRNA hydrolase, PTH1 family
MKIVVGLGNPGAEYKSTRHNAGVMVVDKMAEKLQSDYGWRRKKDILVYESAEITLIKSAEVFMNESGRMVKKMNNEEFTMNNLYVVHDDLDIKLGEYKIQFGVGPKVHGGLLSIERELRTKDFWRVRIGIDNRSVPVDGEQYVLQRFAPEEREVLMGVVEKVAEELMK